MATAYGKVPLIPRIMTEWAHSRTGIDIHPGRKSLAFFYRSRPTGVVIGESTEIGSRVKLYHAVTLGARSFQKDEHGKSKKAENAIQPSKMTVTIYPGSTILGGETVIVQDRQLVQRFLVQACPPTRSCITRETIANCAETKTQTGSTRDEFRE